MIINMIRNLTIRPDETRPVDLLYILTDPTEVKRLLPLLIWREKGLAAFALTDHDTTDGLADALAYAAR